MAKYRVQAGETSRYRYYGIQPPIDGDTAVAIGEAVDAPGGTHSYFAGSQVVGKAGGAYTELAYEAPIGSNDTDTFRAAQDIALLLREAGSVAERVEVAVDVTQIYHIGMGRNLFENQSNR